MTARIPRDPAMIGTDEVPCSIRHTCLAVSITPFHVVEQPFPVPAGDSVHFRIVLCDVFLPRNFDLRLKIREGFIQCLAGCEQIGFRIAEDDAVPGHLYIEDNRFCESERTYVRYRQVQRFGGEDPDHGCA